MPAQVHPRIVDWRGPAKRLTYFGRIPALEACLIAAAGYERVIAEHGRIMGSNADSAYVESMLAAAYRERGDYAAALAEYERTRPTLGSHPFGLAVTLAKMGRRDEARAILGELERRAQREYVLPSSIAAVFESLGERDSALAWVERGLRLHDHCSARPERFQMGGLAADPRYVAVRRRAGVKF